MIHSNRMTQPSITTLCFSYIAIWTVSVMDLWMTSVHSSNIAVGPNPAELSAEHYINLDDDYAIKQLAIIVDALENLSILDSSKRNCYMVDKIAQHSQQIDHTRWRVGVEFYVSLIKPPYIENINGTRDTVYRGDNNGSLSAQDNVTSPCHYVTTATKVVDNDTIAQRDNASVVVVNTGGKHRKDKGKSPVLSLNKLN